MIAAKEDTIGDNFALYIPQEDVIFHRLSKLNFLGENYAGKNGETILMAEITFRPKSSLSKLSNKEILKSTIEGLEKLGFVEEQNIVDTKILTEKYAYIIHDLNCKKNTDTFLSAFKKLGIQSVGRFALFEYLNTDGVVEKSWALADELNNDNL